MALTKTIAIALAAGGLTISSIGPAFADGQRGGQHGNNHGYAKQNHKGYNGGKGHNGGKSYNNNGKHGQKGYDGRNGYNGHKGYDQKHSGYNNKYSDNHYKGGNNQYKGHNQYQYHQKGQNHYNGQKHYNGYKHYNGHRVVTPPRNYKPRYTYNPRQRVVYASQFRNYYQYPNRYAPRYNVGHRIYPTGYTYVIHNYPAYGLYQPPPGYQWVRCDGDAYLAAAGTGLIAGIIIGAMLGY